VLASGRASAVVVGCDRVARNGDTANKLGTLNLAVLARHFAVPFYVAMPWSSYDADTPTGASITIEERDPREVGGHQGGSVDAWNPAFDVTPADLVTAWVTETGVAWSDEGRFPRGARPGA
jgi:methylthioribose-1-phosphate isomerase